MEHSRVKKYKNYRDSFTKVNAQEIDGANIIDGLSNDNTLNNTTSTLPFDEVIKKIDVEEENERANKKLKLKKVLRYAIPIGILVVLIIVLIIIGILAFGGNL